MDLIQSGSWRPLRRSRGARADRQPRAGGAQRRRWRHQRNAPIAVLRRVGRFRRAPRLCTRRRHPPRGLEGVCTNRPVLRQRVRGRLQRELQRACSTCPSRWHSAQGSASSTTAKTLAACLTYLVHKQRDRVGLVTFDEDVVDHVPPSAKHLDVVLHAIDRAQAEAAGSARPAACESSPNTLAGGASSS